MQTTLRVLHDLVEGCNFAMDDEVDLEVEEYNDEEGVARTRFVLTRVGKVAETPEAVTESETSE